MTESLIFSDYFFAMGTHCNVVLLGVENEIAQRIFLHIKKEVENLESMLSRFLPDSQVSVLNRAVKNAWIQVAPELMGILSLCYDYYQISNGAFDVAIGSLISLWEKQPENIPVSAKELMEAKRKSGFHNVELDSENNRLKFKTDGVEFNFAAIEKGLALDIIKPVLVKNGISNGIVSFGESSILTLGKHPNGENWPIGIRNSYAENDFVHLFSASNEIVSTSGTIRTGNNSGDSRKCIVSPETGKLVEGNKTVSVKTEQAILGEFISTTWLILPDSDKEILSEQIKEVEILEVNYTAENDYSTKLTIL